MRIVFQKWNQYTIGKYLGLLGVDNRSPSLDALTELVTAHLTKVPFENISKLYYREHLGLKTIPDINTYLTGIEQYHFGGTCYSNNYYFYSLLANLGYAARLCGADMKSPDVHMAIIVDVDDQEFLVDVGYAAPFFLPIPRDLKADYCITLGPDKYILKPQDTQGNSYLELYRDGLLTHGYKAKLGFKKFSDFPVSDSFRDDATFMNSLLLARFFYPNRSIVIHNLELVESLGVSFSKRSLKDRTELIQVISEYFNIPLEIVRSTLNQLRNLTDPWN